MWKCYGAKNKLRYGVTQRSVLDLTLLALFVNDMKWVLEYCEVHLFAEDMVLLMLEKCNHDLHEVNK